MNKSIISHRASTPHPSPPPPTLDMYHVSRSGQFPGYLPLLTYPVDRQTPIPTEDCCIDKSIVANQAHVHRNRIHSSRLAAGSAR